MAGLKITYQFTVPCEYRHMVDAIRAAAESCDGKPKAKPGGEFSFGIAPKRGMFRIKFLLYASESNGTTTVRIMTSGNDLRKNHLMAYDKFLNALISAGIEIPVVPGDPYIVTTVQLGGGIEQHYSGKQKLSAGGAVVGGLLFGDLGALVGAFGGNSIQGKTKTVLSNSALFLLCYSNGMVEEKEIKKNTKQYVEAMAKLGATPVIGK